ncbi:hypothetical protein NM208_g3588 [Fusarium decemcellulare]|uniref:Uncharacterized protein n=1 Tax=Fusarium decemcellulare TaxID=57161 RepID=A0ACC1SNR2_9HYPO|nr:hypothetical protein NM208_g3588 [Fusarium decemcellulare]
MHQWAETPFSLIRETGLNSRPDIPHQHPAVRLAKNQALTHNVILRSLNASYRQCLAIKPGTTETQDFLFFNQNLCQVLAIHHDVEEEYLFPEIQRLSGNETIMDVNIQEHKAFHDGLDRFEEYITNISPADFRGEELQQLLMGFGKAVETHLHHEIATLLDLHVYDAGEVTKMAKGMHDRTMERSDKFRHFPLFIGCADRSFRLDGQVESFPQIPYFVLWIAKLFFEPRHAGAWRFNPSTTFGQPRACAVELA